MFSVRVRNGFGASVSQTMHASMSTCRNLDKVKLANIGTVFQTQSFVPL